MTEEQRTLILDLLRRAQVAQETINVLTAKHSLAAGLRVAFDVIAERPAPDPMWLRDFYSITGEHMVLTDEGWMPADLNTLEATGAEPMEVLDEVNAPAAT